MKLIFSGDRASKTIKFGKWLRRYFGNLITIALWDGYKSQVYFELKGLRHGIL